MQRTCSCSSSISWASLFDPLLWIEGLGWQVMNLRKTDSMTNSALQGFQTFQRPLVMSPSCSLKGQGISASLEHKGFWYLLEWWNCKRGLWFQAFRSRQEPKLEWLWCNCTADWSPWETWDFWVIPNEHGYLINRWHSDFRNNTNPPL